MNNLWPMAGQPLTSGWSYKNVTFLARPRPGLIVSAKTGNQTVWSSAGQCHEIFPHGRKLCWATTKALRVHNLNHCRRLTADRLYGLNDAVSPVAPADPGAEDLRFLALFDRMAETPGQQLAPDHDNKKESPGRIVDDLLQSPVWELKVTCSPTKLSPDQSTHQPTHTDGARPVMRRQYTRGDDDRPAPQGRPLGPSHYE